MRIALFFLVLLAPGFLFAEDFNGVWKGTLTQEPGGCYPNYFIELQINFNNNSIIGKAYDYYDTSKYVKLSFTGRYNPQTKRMVLIENKVLESNIPPHCIPCIKTYDLIYEKNGNDEMLTGEWKGHVANAQNACPPGKIYLKKVDHSDFQVDIDQNDTLALIQQSIQLAPRIKETVKALVVDAPQIKVELFDNAEIDNDTITVFVNNTLLLYRQRLTDQPLTINFTAFPEKEYELVMYAD